MTRGQIVIEDYPGGPVLFCTCGWVRPVLNVAEDTDSLANGHLRDAHPGSYTVHPAPEKPHHPKGVEP